MASTEVTAAVCICLPTLVVGRSHWREHAGQDATRQKGAGDLQMFSAYLVPSR